MTLHIQTARVTYGGPNRLDVTRGTAQKYRHETGEAHPGEPFAPSRAILNPALDLMHNATAALAFNDGRDAFARIVLKATWSLYREAYTLEMRESYRRHRGAWDALLARDRVVLCCFCHDPQRCHRTVLAALLAKLGAVHKGEVLP